MLIAVSLFIIVATISIGAILSVFNANKKAQSSKTVVDNLNLSIENMARTVRFGSSYYCGTILNQNDTLSTNDCSTGNSSISITFAGARVIYRLNGTAIQKSDDGLNYINITSSDTTIEYLKFYVFGSTISDNFQPYIIAVIEGHVGNKPTTQTTFSIETLMSQRTLDI